uniref:Myelin and lymphocyte protein n=1 Tax=Varanus komodoensis TaxID=61221 RepID=A0A8D2LEN6_VARKO
RAPEAASRAGSILQGFSVGLSQWQTLFPLALQVFGGLVWILVASTRVAEPMSQGWVMFVSVFCFVISTLLLFLYMCGAHCGKSAWVTLDAFYHVIASIFYLSAAVLQAYVTYLMKTGGTYKNYQIDIAAVVKVHLAPLLFVFRCQVQTFLFHQYFNTF